MTQPQYLLLKFLLYKIWSILNEFLKKRKFQVSSSNTFFLGKRKRKRKCIMRIQGLKWIKHHRSGRYLTIQVKRRDLRINSQNSSRTLKTLIPTFSHIYKPNIATCGFLLHFVSKPKPHSSAHQPLSAHSFICTKQPW